MPPEKRSDIRLEVGDKFIVYYRDDATEMFRWVLFYLEENNIKSEICGSVLKFNKLRDCAKEANEILKDKHKYYLDWKE